MLIFAVQLCPLDIFAVPVSDVVLVGLKAKLAPIRTLSLSTPILAHFNKVVEMSDLCHFACEDSTLANSFIKILFLLGRDTYEKLQAEVRLAKEELKSVEKQKPSKVCFMFDYENVY